LFEILKIKSTISLTFSQITDITTTYLAGGGMICEREFDDGTSTQFIFNPGRESVTVNGTSRNANVIIVHDDGAGTIIGREYIVDPSNTIGTQNDF